MGQERWSSIWDGRRRPPLAAYPRLGGAGRTLPPIWPCSGWGLPCHHCYQWCGGLLPHRFTLTRISGVPSIRAVSFLWPFPSPCGAQALPGSLPCGARTFLGHLAAPATIRPTSGLNIAEQGGSGEAGWQVPGAYALLRQALWNQAVTLIRLSASLIPHSPPGPVPAPPAAEMGAVPDRLASTVPALRDTALEPRLGGPAARRRHPGGAVPGPACPSLNRTLRSAAMRAGTPPAPEALSHSLRADNTPEPPAAR